MDSRFRGNDGLVGPHDPALMKINDAIWGAVLLLLAAVILVHVQSFPKIPGQQVGPALFPGLIAAGLGVCALLLVAKGLAARTAGGGHRTLGDA